MRQNSNGCIVAGGNASFSILAQGSEPLSYRWQKNGANLHNGGHYSGVTTPTLTITSADTNEVADYRWPRLSPDGRHIAVGALVIGESRLAGAAIWVFDLATGSHTRLQDDGVNTEPVWTSDSRRVVYSSNRGAGAGVNLYWQAADGSGNSELLSRLPFEQWPTDVFRDGRLLAFYGQPKGQGYGIWTVTLEGTAKTEQVLSSTGVLRGARFSPDGRWLGQCAL